MRLPIVLGLLLGAALPASLAVAQTRPGFWEVSVRAAADAGLDSSVAPIALTNALRIAEEHDKNGIRPVLSRLQLMLAYIAADKFDLYRELFGLDKFNINVAKVDLAIRDYLPTLRSLQNAYYARWRAPSNDEKDGVRFEALAYASKNFAELEIAIRQKIAQDDRLALADALANRGLVFRHRGERNRAIDDYENALGIYAATRRTLAAMANADRDFSVQRADDAKKITVAPDEELDNFTLSVDEQYIYPVIAAAALGDLEAAIDRHEFAEADNILATIEQARAQGDYINIYMYRRWPCHQNNLAAHFFRAETDKLKMRLASRRDGASGPLLKKYFEEADAEYRKWLEIEVFSDGFETQSIDTAHFYVDFLNEAAQQDAASRVAAIVKSLGKTDIGTGGPTAWREALDCESLSR
jgi:hypothetical protein